MRDEYDSDTVDILIDMAPRELGCPWPGGAASQETAQRLWDAAQAAERGQTQAVAECRRRTRGARPHLPPVQRLPQQPRFAEALPRRGEAGRRLQVEHPLSQYMAGVSEEGGDEFHRQPLHLLPL